MFPYGNLDINKGMKKIRHGKYMKGIFSFLVSLKDNWV